MDIKACLKLRARTQVPSVMLYRYHLLVSSLSLSLTFLVFLAANWPCGDKESFLIKSLDLREISISVWLWEWENELKPCEAEEGYICLLREMLLTLSSLTASTCNLSPSWKKCDHASEVRILRKCQASHHWVRRAPERDKRVEISLRIFFQWQLYIAFSLVLYVFWHGGQGHQFRWLGSLYCELWDIEIWDISLYNRVEGFVLPALWFLSKYQYEADMHIRLRWMAPCKLQWAY